MNAEIILVMVVLSLLLQAAAAILSLLLIPATGKKAAWTCVSIALLLMAVRRLYSLQRASVQGLELSVPFEFIGLALSLLMLLGVWGIRKIIRSQIDAEQHARTLAKQRETLLREVHHRVKNNMNTIRILLGIRAGKLPAGDAATALHAAEGQVESMMILYDRLYRSPTVTHVNAADYIRSLVKEICLSMQGACSPSLDIEVEEDVEETELEAAESFFLGILLNEIVTNAIKYAFPGTENPQLRIRLAVHGEELRITVRDNGRGFPDGFDWRQSTGFGMTLIQAMADQLKDSISVDSDSGVCWSIAYRRS